MSRIDVPSAPKQPRPWVARLTLLAFSIFVLTLAGVIQLVSWVTTIEAGLPPAPQLQSIPVSVSVVDRDGLLLRPFTTADGRWRLPAQRTDVDKRFIDMLIAYEDRGFGSHEGIAWSSMVRAAGQFLGAGGRVVSGGSTLTMQVARLLEGQSTRNAWGKLRQMVHAKRLEADLSKDEILDLYLTLAPYGGNIEGIRAASLAYFGKEPARLTTAEAALLVALPQSPEARRPDRDPEAALASRNMVLDRLVATGTIAAEEARAAKLEPIPDARRQFPMLAAHMADAAVRSQRGTAEVALTLDKRLQEALERLATARSRLIDPRVSVAILAADIETGEVLASVGSAGLFARESAGFVDMTTAIRSPGSTLKPLIYGLAFELGLAHPQSLIEDRPTAFGGYVPVNFDGFNRGTVTIHDALTESLNIPAVVVLDAVGPARLVSRLRRAHANPRLPVDTAPSLAVGLGGVGISLRDLVSLYAAIGNGGESVRLHDGIAPAMETDRTASVLDPVSAWYVADILADVPPPLNGSPGRVAYKTGTSYGYRDAWSIGFDGKTVIGVWVGRPDGAPVPGLSGITAAAPILFEAFDRLGARRSPLPRAPVGVLHAANPDLPLPLRRFRHPNQDMVARVASPEIAFPADGVDVDLGLVSGAEASLVVKVRNGVPPFTFFANGAPFGRSHFARQDAWSPDGPGYVTLSVVDAEGRGDSVTVFLN
ncbi:penicillin-binding protein 1C [Devosia crocina]|uniref:peptidoglycan glycosyltransferase n=1 Tax=Devosia crocina TaxID=429728 RepID=A0A1I7N2V8_9HYPH|nr:penicillin-binding protein 1C [Devosia crocina]SFV28958.1 penicillin-binding protein 1C [Devosia crocina]